MGETEDRAWLSSVGERLRETRIAAGITLEEAARQTKLSVRQLTAIEEGDWARLPAPVYVRGFIRTYAGLLGISDPLPRTGDTPRSAPSAREGKNASGRKWPGKLIVPGLLLLSMIFLSFFYDDPPPVSRPTPPRHLPHSGTHPVLSNSSTPHPKPVRQHDVTAAEGEERGTPTAEGTGVILRLKVNEQCWLQVTIDDSVSRQYDLQAGDLIEWKAGRLISLDIGNAGGVEAELNGSPLPPFGERGDVVHLTFRADEASMHEQLPAPSAER